MTSQKPAKDLSIGFIGAGTVGTALAVGLAHVGYQVKMVASKSPTSAKRLASQIPDCEALPTPAQVVDSTDLVFLTVPDDAIQSLASSLPWRNGQLAIHSSGATSLEAIASASNAGALIGAFHPLQTFASGEQTLTGVTFAIESPSEYLRCTLDQMASDLGATGLTLPKDARALYHVSGVLASNYLVTLLAEAADLWAQFGYNRAEALNALLPLVQGTVGNIASQGIPQALTGPIARGDSGTVAAHLVSLEEQSPETLLLYKEMARKTLRLAVEKGQVPSEDASRIHALIEGDQVQGGPTA